jgi:hypothetical protein
VSKGEVYLDVIFENIWVDPSKHLLLRIEENHVFIDDEVAVEIGKSPAGIYDSFCVEISLLDAIELL